MLAPAGFHELQDLSINHRFDLSVDFRTQVFVRHLEHDLYALHVAIRIQLRADVAAKDFIKENAKGVDVGLLAEDLVLQEFWSHPWYRSKSLSLLQLIKIEGFRFENTWR